MFVVESYSLAVILCVVTMFCWGSWANTQKLASKDWRFQLFYWDYAIGVLLLTLALAFTLGSTGPHVDTSRVLATDGEATGVALIPVEAGGQNLIVVAGGAT